MLGQRRDVVPYLGRERKQSSKQRRFCLACHNLRVWICVDTVFDMCGYLLWIQYLLCVITVFDMCGYSI